MRFVPDSLIITHNRFRGIEPAPSAWNIISSRGVSAQIGTADNAVNLN
jgi:hypothetical protein